KWEHAMESGDLKAAKKIGPQIAEYTSEMIQETTDLCDVLGVSWIVAPMEAEGAAAVRAKNGELHAVATQDWDALLYGAPIMIRNLMSHGTKKFGRTLTAERIILKDLLDEHGITHEQLVDLGIMIGTDFHPGFKGVGPKTGLKLIKAHDTLENVAEIKGLEVPHNIEEIRNLFLNHPINEDMDLPPPKRAVEERIREFVQNERGFSENRTMRALDRLASVGKLRSESKPTLFDF
ncbi:MAG: flap structure-specific endonuclease, partial [Candidatus Thermoplasmatota archaeon]|nr:flap structure-specific endonuclease [Candidatus Thermoplasmatota archaeon]